MSDFSFQQAFEWLSSAIASVVFYAIPINGAALPITVLWLVLGAVVLGAGCARGVHPVDGQ